MLGTENMALNTTATITAGSVGINPFLARVGQTTTVDPTGRVRISNPVDVGAALSVAPYRASIVGSFQAGPVTVRARLVDPVFLTTDATTAGIVVRPTTRVTSYLFPQFSTSAAYNPNGKDIQAARQLIESVLQNGTTPNPAAPTQPNNQPRGPSNP
jgi:hypothetical protein